MQNRSARNNSKWLKQITIVPGRLLGQSDLASGADRFS